MVTALELTQEERKKYIKSVRNQINSSVLTATEQLEFDKLLKLIEESAKILKSRFSVKRVVLFGSLAHKSWFSDKSDVDLAVEGLASDQYWEAWRAVEEIIKERSVDLIELEYAKESLKRDIQDYGVEL